MIDEKPDWNQVSNCYESLGRAIYFLGIASEKNTKPEAAHYLDAVLAEIKSVEQCINKQYRDWIQGV